MPAGTSAARMAPFKTLLSPELVRWLGHHIARVGPGFERAAFEAEALAQLDALELKARAQHIADTLDRFLPRDPAHRATILRDILHPDELDHANKPSDDEGVCGWAILPLSLLVGQTGIADFDRGMELQRAFTKRFSSEFGIRHFLIADQPRALEVMRGWLEDPNRHVRRLISEGTRPRLPWAMQLTELRRDPAPVLPLLAALRDDPEDYVRKSVANHLNDITKDHPSLAVALAGDWMEGAGDRRRRLIRHGLRGLIKRGDPAALAVFGQRPPEAEIGPLALSAGTVRMGEALEMRLALRSTSAKAQRLTIDYLLHFRKANGTLSPKVFKGAEVDLAPGAEHVFERRHVFREVTTRRHYPGEQALSLRINGRDTPPVSFRLDPALE